MYWSLQLRFRWGKQRLNNYYCVHSLNLQLKDNLLFFTIENLDQFANKVPGSRWGLSVNVTSAIFGRSRDFWVFLWSFHINMEINYITSFINFPSLLTSDLHDIKSLISVVSCQQISTLKWRNPIWKTIHSRGSRNCVDISRQTITFRQFKS